MSFVKTNCYAGAYLYDSSRSRDPNEQKQFLLKALELKRDYDRANLSLAGYYYRNKDYTQCRRYLKPILLEETNLEYGRASELFGDCFYSEKNYEEALKNYQKALAYADYDEHKYELYYWIAQCYDAVNDRQKAENFFQKFLADNWEQDKSGKLIKHAREYQDSQPGEEEDVQTN